MLDIMIGFELQISFFYTSVHEFIILLCYATVIVFVSYSRKYSVCVVL